MKDTWPLCRIGKQYHFSAAHYLPKVHDGHPCKRMHGHNYVVEVEIRNEISPIDGFCGNIDFYKVDEVMNPLIKRLDHRTLNDIPGLENPTAELIAKWILDNYEPAILFSVKVWETPKCYAQVINRDGYFQKAHRE